jgi:hypothetical protein
MPLNHNRNLTLTLQRCFYSPGALPADQQKLLLQESSDVDPQQSEVFRSDPRRSEVKKNSTPTSGALTHHASPITHHPSRITFHGSRITFHVSLHRICLDLR